MIEENPTINTAFLRQYNAGCYHNSAVIASCFLMKFNTVEPRFNEVAGDRPNLFVKSRARCIENLDITNLRGNDQNVHYIEVIVKGAGSPFEHAHSGCEG